MLSRVLSVGAMLFLTTSAIAQGTEEQRAACTNDAMRYCGDRIFDGEAAIERCLEMQLPNLTPACRAQFDEPAPLPPPLRQRR